VQRLNTAVVDINAKLKYGSWIAGLIIAVIGWLAIEIFRLQGSVGELRGSVAAAVEPLKSAAGDIRAAAKNMQDAAESSTKAAQQMQTGSQELANLVKPLDALLSGTAEYMKNGSQELAKVVNRLDAVSRQTAALASAVKGLGAASVRTSEVSATVLLDATNLRQEGQFFQATLPLPETLEQTRLREIKARLGASAPPPGVSLVSFVARPEGRSYFLQVWVPRTELNAAGDFLRQGRAIHVEVTFVLLS
jgi:hypothetical protein